MGEKRLLVVAITSGVIEHDEAAGLARLHRKAERLTQSPAVLLPISGMTTSIYGVQQTCRLISI